ncbi:hypothetical protein GCE9029_04638 [Grimontia celer]|uniref:Uncharacterized protein n=1 Tax=Grimontia celer TaxID=1796497 RepID=A0A128FEU9_9GAMM|nr:hypothetical protein GCE9029_04638 [Grimontia celer]
MAPFLVFAPRNLLPSTRLSLRCVFQRNAKRSIADKPSTSVGFCGIYARNFRSHVTVHRVAVYNVGAFIGLTVNEVDHQVATIEKAFQPRRKLSH